MGSDPTVTGASRQHTPSTSSVRATFHAGTRSFAGSFNDTPIAQAIVGQLPITSTVNRWGEEIYFTVPVKMANTQPTRSVMVGDIAYWPDGPSLCLFFGKTPASRADEPRPASDVTIVGHTDASAELLRALVEGMRITVTRGLR